MSWFGRGFYWPFGRNYHSTQDFSHRTVPILPEWTAGKDGEKSTVKLLSRIWSFWMFENLQCPAVWWEQDVTLWPEWDPNEPQHTEKCSMMLCRNVILTRFIWIRWQSVTSSLQCRCHPRLKKLFLFIEQMERWKCKINLSWSYPCADLIALLCAAFIMFIIERSIWFLAIFSFRNHKNIWVSYSAHIIIALVLSLDFILLENLVSVLN